MAAALTELLQAVDSYMKTNGGGEKFLAKKLASLFKSTQSPFSLEKGGVLDNLKTAINGFTDKIESLGSTDGIIDTFTQNMTGLNIETHIFKNKVKTAHQTLDKLIKNLNSFNLPQLPPVNQPINANLAMSGKRYDVRALDVNIVNVRDIVFDRFFQNMQKRFSSESVLSKPDDKGKRHYIHGIDVNIQHIGDKALEQLGKIKKSNYLDRPDESGGIISKIFGYITSGLTLFGGIAGISYLLEKTPLGKTIKNKIKQFGSFMSDKFSELLKSGFIQDLFGNIKSVSVKAFVYIRDGITNFLNRNQDSIWKLVGDATTGIFNAIKDFSISTFNFYGMKEKMGDEGSGIATILTKGLFKGLMSLVKVVANKLTFGLAESGAKGIGSLLKGGGIKIFDSIGLKWGAKLLKVFKFIPVVGALLSFHSMVGRFRKGDIVGGFIDLISGGLGIASLFPPLYPIMTGLSIGLDVLNAFLDYKQAKTGETKGQLIGDFFGMISGWLADKFSYENMKKMPILGGFVRMYDAVGQIKNGDMMGGLKTMMSAIGWLTPLSFLPQMFGFLDWISGGQATANIPESIKNLLNPDKFVETVVVSIGSLVGKVMNFINGLIDIASQKIDQIKGGISDNWTKFKKMITLDESYGPLGPNKQIKKVDDAVVVQPHSKDQILMAKTGGPFDMAMKRMIEKLDEEIQILQDGFTMLIQATTSGSTQVAQTVAATASVKSNTPSIGGGRNPVGDFRTKANERIRR